MFEHTTEKVLDLSSTRYALFAGGKFYPSGSYTDFKLGFDTPQEVLEFINERNDRDTLKDQYAFFEVLDTESKKLYFFDELEELEKALSVGKMVS